MESSPLFQLGRGRAQVDSDDEWDEYMDNESGLHEVSLLETEMAALRPIRTIASPVKSRRRNLLFDEYDDVPLCSLSPFLDEDCCSSRSATSPHGIQRRRWWRGRTAQSMTLGLAVCLVLAAVMMGWFSSSYRSSDNWAHTEARALADALDDDFRITFPDGAVSSFHNRISEALGSLLGGEEAVREGGLRNMVKDAP